jgi:hypothetical protein
LSTTTSFYIKTYNNEVKQDILKDVHLNIKAVDHQKKNKATTKNWRRKGYYNTPIPMGRRTSD